MKKKTQGALERQMAKFAPATQRSVPYKKVRDFVWGRSAPTNIIRPVVQTDITEDFSLGVKSLLDQLELDYEEGNDHDRKITLGKFIRVTTKVVPSKVNWKSKSDHWKQCPVVSISEFKKEYANGFPKTSRVIQLSGAGQDDHRDEATKKDLQFDHAISNKLKNHEAYASEVDSQRMENRIMESKIIIDDMNKDVELTPKMKAKYNKLATGDFLVKQIENDFEIERNT